eukprot:168486-Rhodomonas_salina.1
MGAMVLCEHRCAASARTSATPRAAQAQPSQSFVTLHFARKPPECPVTLATRDFRPGRGVQVWTRRASAEPVAQVE